MLEGWKGKKSVLKLPNDKKLQKSDTTPWARKRLAEGSSAAVAQFSVKRRYLAGRGIMRLVLEVLKRDYRLNCCCPGWESRKLPLLPFSLQ